ncbi:MAG: SRPBCC family protein [Acidobacteria bacterium]|nr:SRPBCC family protein [Acidobacteriota bacterium]
MPVITIETEISAPIGRVFDLARSIDLHAASQSKSQEKAVAGVTEGLIGLNESVTWEATHFGVRQRLSSIITAYKKPFYFQDVMVEGAFRRFAHDHFFKQKDLKTVLMTEIFDYESPFRIFGRIADALFLERYMRRLLTEKSLVIKRTAEGDDWRKFL